MNRGQKRKLKRLANDYRQAVSNFKENKGNTDLTKLLKAKNEYFNYLSKVENKQIIKINGNIFKVDKDYFNKLKDPDRYVMKLLKNKAIKQAQKIISEGKIEERFKELNGLYKLIKKTNVLNEKDKKKLKGIEIALKESQFENFSFNQFSYNDNDDDYQPIHIFENGIYSIDLI